MRKFITKTRIFYFSIILFVLQYNLFFKSKVVNFPNWIYIALIFLSVLIFLLTYQKKLIKYKSYFVKDLIVFSSTFMSVSLFVFGASNYIYTKYQEVQTAQCKIVKITMGTVRLPARVYFLIDNKTLNISWPTSRELRDLSGNKQRLNQSKILISYKKGLMGMYSVEDVSIE